MFCKYCGNEVNPNAAVCLKCGSFIEDHNHPVKTNSSPLVLSTTYILDVITSSCLFFGIVTGFTREVGVIVFVIAVILSILGFVFNFVDNKKGNITELTKTLALINFICGMILLVVFLFSGFIR